jgi:hypothetical protein
MAKINETFQSQIIDEKCITFSSKAFCHRRLIAIKIRSLGV